MNSSMYCRFAYKNIIIGGDLNCNLLGTGFEAASLRESVSSHALSIVDSGSTFHTSTAHILEL